MLEPNWIHKISRVVESLGSMGALNEEMDVEECITAFSRGESTLLEAQDLLHSLFMQFIGTHESWDLMISSLFDKLPLISVHWLCLLLSFNNSLLGERKKRVSPDKMKRKQFSPKLPFLVVDGDDGVSGFEIRITKSSPSKNDLLSCLRIVLEGVYIVFDGKKNIPFAADRFKSMIDAGSAIVDEKKMVKARSDIISIIAQSKAVLEVFIIVPDNV
jgi:hypothetical protein